MRRREFCLGLVAMPALARSAIAQEVASITLIKQHGLPYLPLMLMEELRLVEKHAARLGVPNLKTDYRTLGGTQSLVDALIGGQMHFGIAGVPGLATLWDKTVGTPNEVRALCAAQAMPFILVDQPAGDQDDQGFQGGPQDRGAGREELQPGDLPADGGREGMGTGQLCAARSAHDHAAASGRGDRDHLAVDRARRTLRCRAVPELELAAPGMHAVLKSYDTLGGPTTNGVVFMAKKFRDANPKVTSAVYAAFEEAPK